MNTIKDKYNKYCISYNCKKIRYLITLDVTMTLKNTVN